MKVPSCAKFARIQPVPIKVDEEVQVCTGHFWFSTESPLSRVLPQPKQTTVIDHPNFTLFLLLMLDKKQGLVKLSQLTSRAASAHEGSKTSMQLLAFLGAGWRHSFTAPLNSQLINGKNLCTPQVKTLWRSKPMQRDVDKKENSKLENLKGLEALEKCRLVTEPVL